MKHTRNDVDSMWQAIDELDFERIKAKMMHRQRGGSTPDAVTRAELGYRQFLKLAAKYPSVPVVPNEAVDEFWHMHILDTRRYADDCERIFGHLLHHDPYVGIDGPEDEARLMDLARASNALLAQEFRAEGAPAFCAVEPAVKASAAFCAVEPAAKASAAFCAVEPAVKASAAFCAVEPAVKASAAFCAVEPAAKASAAFCAVEPAVQASAAFCAVEPAVQASAAFCAVEPAVQASAAFCAVEPAVKVSAAFCAVEPRSEISADVHYAS
jgi:hypothetical protein